MSLSGVNAGYLDVRNAILRVGTLDVQTIVSGVDTATNIAKTNTILLWDDQGSDMNSPPFILTSATRSTSPPYLELGGGVAHVGIKLPNAWLGAFEVYMSDKTDGSIKLHTYTTDTTSYGDTGYELVLNSSGVTLNYDGAQVATAAYTWTNDTWHQVVVGFERGAWTVSVDGTPTLIKDDIEREAVYANVGQYLRIDAASATTTKRVRYVKFAANGQWLQSNTGTLSYTQGNVVIGAQTTNYALDVRGTVNVGALTMSSNLAVDTNTLFVDAVNSKVGVGTTNPSYALDVVGDINLTSNIVMNGEVFIKAHDATSNHVAIGPGAGQTEQNTYTVAIGYQAGQIGQNTAALAVGYLAGQTSQGNNATAVGRNAGQTSQGSNAISVGFEAGKTSQGEFAIAVGRLTGKSTQGDYAIAVGQRAGQNTQGTNAVAVGSSAARYNQGTNAVAVGYLAGETNQHANTVVLNASGSALDTEGTERTYIKPLRVATVASNVMTYDQTTGEVMDSGGLISNKLAIVSEQPPAALTAATTTVNGHGKYSVYASNVATNSNAWNAFDQSSSVYWQSTGVYSGGVGGEYLKITFPYKTTLRHVVYTGASGAYTSWAKAANIAGSNDDSTWTQLASFSGFGPTSNDPKTMIVNATTSYKHYKFTITENSGSVNYATVAQLKLFTESFSVDGGIVTTTAASGLETGFTEHPVAPMTGFNTYVEGHGTYEASASSYNAAQSSAEPWRAFDYNTVTGSWRTTGFSNSTYLYTGPDVLVDAGGTRYNGPSLTIKIPYAIVLSHSTFNVWGGTFGYETSPKVGYIFGSNNGVDWYKLFYISDFGFEDVEGGNIKTVSINATTPYTHYAFVCTEKNNTGTATAMNLNEWRLFSATGVTKMDNVLISGELAVHGGALQTSHIKWPKVPLKANESEGYVASASSTYNTLDQWKAWHAFENKSQYGGNYPAWVSGDNTFINSTGLPDTANCATFDNLSCEWIQIKQPTAIQLSSFKFKSRYLSSTPVSGAMYGSNDDFASYDKLTSFSDNTELEPVINVQSTEKYNAFRLVVTATTTAPNTDIDELQLFESTLGVGTSATTAKLTVDGGLGLAKGSQVFAGSDVVTEFPKHDRPLTKYPEVAMTAATTGGYVASASSNYIGNSPYFGYTGTVNPSFLFASQTYSSSNGSYTGSNSLAGIPGEYLNLELPKKINIRKVRMYSRNSVNYSNPPRKARIFGSNDNISWTQLGIYENDNTPEDGSSVDIFINTHTGYYNYFAFLIETVILSNYSQPYACIGELEYYGTEEGDESVDIVHKSIPNKPGQQQLAVYYEARDSNSYSFADSSNVYDLSGNGRTGTLTGGVGFDAEYNAFTFDGVDDYISGTLSNPAGDWVHSISLWFKADSFTAGKDSHTLFCTGSESANNGLFLRFGSNQMNFIGIGYSDLGRIARIDMTPELGVWYHVVATYSGGGWNNAKIYMNGSSKNYYVDGTDTTPLTLSASSPFFVAKTINGSNPSFDGSIANFRLYSKALNADQVRELYEYDAERFGHRQNLVALHKGNLGVGVTNPTSRFEVAGADGLQEYPPRGITQPGTSYVGYRLEEYIEGHGQYVIDGSSSYNSGGDDRRTWALFDKGLKLFHGASYFTTGTPAAIDEATTTAGNNENINFNTKLSSGATIFADWAQIELPHKILLKRNIVRNHNILTRSAAKGYIVASNDGLTFDVLNTIDDFGYITTYQDNVFETTTNTYYRIFRILFTHKVGGDANGAMNMREWRLFGTPAPSSLEDGHLTLGKALTLPRVSGHPAGAETPRAESLVVHYDTTVDSVVAGSTVVDTSGNGLNGTLNGAVYDTTERALTFDGVDDYVSGTLNNPAGAWVHSVSCWYKPLSTTTGVVWAIGTNSNSKQIAINNDGGVIKYFIYGCSGTPSPTSTFTTNKWHHIVAVFRNSETTATGGVLTGRDLYIDGVKQTMTAINTQFALNLNANITFRLANQYNSLYNHSSISNFKLWNVALTAEEVAAEYTLGRTGKSINLTDTTLCLGGTVPRAQLDVRGVAYIDKLHLGASGTSLTPPKTAAMFATSTHSSNYSHLDSTWRDVWHHDFDSNWNFRLAQYHDPGVTVKHGLRWKHNAVDDNNITFYGSNVGIGTTSPGTKTHIHQSGTGSNDGLRLSTSSSQYWDIYNSSGNDLAFRYGGGSNGGYIQDTVDVANIDFTGQHRNFIDGVPYTEYDTLEGLIVSANKNKYYDINEDITTGANAIQISQSLPLVSLSTKEKDKACFGVISGSEDPEKREYSQGSFVSVVQKQKGDRRAFINSLGEGAMWVTNINGPLESGDYITTSNVAGYGQRQDDDILHNYTVAKITMDCDFNPPDIPVQRILKELSNITYWYQLEDATSDAYDRTQEETYYTLDRRVEVHGHVDEQSNVFVEPVHDLELYTRTQQNVITEEVYNALPEDERVLYDSNTFTYTQVTELAPEVWADLDGEEQNTYVRDYFNIVTDEVPSETPGAVECTRTVYKKIVNETKVEPATPEDYFSEVRQEWVNVLDAHDQLQWEDVPWGETEPAYKVRYLDADGKITTRHNEVHRAAFVGVTYHCG
jgi:hypothetical protein